MIRHLLTATILLATTALMAADSEAWKSLFNGKDLTGGTTEKGKPVTKGWVVEDGLLFRKGKGGSIVTVDDYEDFELEIEWKISKAGNSGIK